jgi:7-carboxy-7-deazaguanine synthase
MSYAVKEMFLTLQGEGVQAGRRAVFVRFAGCNLWSGREADRARAICRFCDTDFVGTDGEGGGRFADAAALVSAVEGFWGTGAARRFVVLTGGEPMLQVDDALVAALHEAGFEIAMESNGTLPAHPGLDWLCISPKAGSSVVQRSGDELKLVWPQAGTDIDDLEGWDFPNLLVQPLDDANAADNHAAAIALVMDRPRWRLTVQAHKMLGLR